MTKKQFITLSPIKGYENTKKTTPTGTILELDPNDKLTERWLHGGTIKPYVKPAEPPVASKGDNAEDTQRREELDKLEYNDLQAVATDLEIAPVNIKRNKLTTAIMEKEAGQKA